MFVSTTPMNKTLLRMVDEGWVVKYDTSNGVTVHDNAGTGVAVDNHTKIMLWRLVGAGRLEVVDGKLQLTELGLKTISRSNAYRKTLAQRKQALAQPAVVKEVTVPMVFEEAPYTLDDVIHELREMNGYLAELVNTFR